MLNEGVDLPDAKTAFLARPTKNRILLKQMVGRVLRGTPAGGTAEAHVVDFRDDWPSLARILGPESAFDGVVPMAEQLAEVDGNWEPLFPALATLFAPPATDEALAPESALAITVERPRSLTLAGCWRLDDQDVPLVPVLLHQEEAFEAFAERAKNPTRMRSLEFFFEDLPEPRPPIEHLQALRRALQADAARYVNVGAAVGAAAAVERIRRDEVQDPDARLELIREIHETTPAHLVEPSLERFAEEVHQLLDRGVTWRDDALRAVPDRPLLTRLQPRERPLTPLLHRVAERGRPLLPEEVCDRLQVPPSIGIDWTRSEIKFAFGYHRFDADTGEQVIRINRLLLAPREEVSDELLEFLIWHELLHHVLLRQGHDAQFYELERAWPDAAERDGELAMFHERWATDPPCLQRRVTREHGTAPDLGVPGLARCRSR